MRNDYDISQALMGIECDAPVPYYEVGVSCGLPSEMGDLPPEMILLPSMMTRGRRVFIVNACGDSMQGIGIYDGDPLLLESTRSVHTGEAVMVSIDGEELLKTYYVDDSGRHWLLPANDKYEPKELTADMDVRFCGRLICNLRTPHDAISHCGEVVRRFKLRQKQQEPDAFQRLATAITQGAHLFWAASAWAVAFCVMRDCCQQDDNMKEFERRAAQLPLPAQFAHRCKEGTVQRTVSNHPYMRKPIDKWQACGASKRELALLAFLEEQLK